ncbi:MAG: FUSC family protein [Leadbetterella sp.]|nr:FUSC family protein [Leadbetterella sp.]
MLHRANKHILSFDFFKSAVLCLIMGGALLWGYYTHNYKAVFPLAIGALFAYFPNIEGSQRHRIAGIVLGFAWSSLMLAVQLSLFDTPKWLHFSVMLFFVFITSMVAVYGLRGGNISFGGLFAIVSSYGIHAMGLPHAESLVLVLVGGVVYIVLSAVSQFFYQGHHIRTMLADCVEYTAEYYRKLEQQVWDSKDLESDILHIESRLNTYHEVLRSALLNKPGRLLSSNKTRRQYLIFKEIIDLYEMALAAHHDLEEAREHFDGTEPLVQPYREFTLMMVEELERFGELLRLNRNFSVNPKLQTKLLESEENLKPLLRSRSREAHERQMILRNLIDLKNKQLNCLRVISKHYENLFFTEKIRSQSDARFITTQDYSYKILLSNLNLDSSIFRHSVRLSAAIAICFLLQDVISDENTSWIIATCIVVLRPNYGLTRSRAYDRIAGTLLGGIITLAILYVTDYKPVLLGIAGFSLMLGFSYVATRYLLASTYITLAIILLYVAFTGRSFDLVLDRVFYTFIGSAIALFTIYFIFPVWEKESIFTAIRKAINANRRYLDAVNRIYETKEPVDTEFKLVRKEAFVKNGNLYEAFQRMKDDPKSKRSQLSNSYAVVLLSHSLLKGVAAYSTYIQNHQTTRVSEDFKTVMRYIMDQLRVAANVMEGLHETKTMVSDPLAALESLDKYYYGLSRLRELELSSGVAQMSYETSVKLQEGRMILDQVKSLKSLAENTLQMCRLLTANQ